MSDIIIKGAREHNLRDVDLRLPRNKLICLTGVSGSGKSSLAFDTLYAEGQRRYVESLSSFARQFLGQMPKPDVDLIEGLSPSISISQKSTGKNPRSTVGTITEIHDYLRILFARVSQGHCPRCGRPITAQTREQIIGRILQLPEGTRLTLLSPLIRGQKGEHRDLFEDLLKQGFVRARVDGQVVSLADRLQLDRQMRHDIELVIDRLVIDRRVRARLAEAVELALKMGRGNLIAETSSDGESNDERPAESGPPEEVASSAPPESPSGEESRGATRTSQRGRNANDIVFSVDYACTSCGVSFQPPSPQLFSFNSPQGMCFECDGLGQLFSFDPDLLIPDGGLSFKDGCIELLGPWKELSRWRRHIYQGVATTMERVLGIESGALLETPWRELDERSRNVWLWGTGDQHVTYTWRGGTAPIKYGGKFDGIIPELLAKYRGAKSRIHLRQLEKYMNTIPCPDCRGQRLVPQARSAAVTTRHARFAERPARTLPEICGLPVSDAVDFFSDLELDSTRALIAAEVLKEIRGRLGFLMNVGLDYLSLDRTAPTLSGGESQRIRLAGQIGSGLVGVLYILDEPSIGLHARDNGRLLDTLASLRDMGNTVVVVEHDEETMLAADHIIDFGPGPGVRGGEVVAQGPADEVMKEERSLTGQYLSGGQRIETPTERRPIDDRRLRVVGAAHNNLKDVDVEIPLGSFVCVTGVSGSGKSSLINDILVEALRRDLNRGEGHPGRHERIEGLEHLDKLIAIDQSPIGRTPRSNPGTYIKVFDEIRNLYARLPESKRRGYKAGRFSFNVKGGRCEACEGNGSNRLEMDFLADVWVTCPVCEGHRYNRETLQARFKERSIAEVLEMDVQQLMELFENIPKVQAKLQTLHDVGLDYLKLGQPSPTLSGGEAQRIKLARELVKKSTGQTLYLLDEPTTGLHFADIKLLLSVLHGFVDAGNTVLVVEHNLDVIKTADWIIDLGPEGGARGGRVVAAGRPEDVVKVRASHTGRSLAPVLKSAVEGTSSRRTAPRRRKGSRAAAAVNRTKIRVQGARQHNLKQVDVELHRDKMTVFSGPSGSGKSSLAMDTIYAEGQRRYVESLSAYARQFVNQMEKPLLDHIDGLSPAIAIEQKNLGNTPRSTVGTVTEIYDYVRILMARLGAPYCPGCDLPIGTQTAEQIADKIMREPEETRLVLAAPVEADASQEYASLWDELRSRGYARVRVDGKIHSLETPPSIDRRRRHDVEIVIDRIVVRSAARSRIAESVEQALAVGKGVVTVIYPRDGVAETRWETVRHSQHLACDRCGRSFETLTPHNFSFNSYLGWCRACEGLGIQTGANPAALLKDPKKSLLEGAVDLWPDVRQVVSQWMLRAMSDEVGLPIDIPFQELDARHRRMIFHGTGDRWFDVKSPSGDENRGGPTIFRFQFKGLYPALEEASRLSPSLRSRLEHLIDEVECSACGGSRLRDDAAAMRFRDLTVDAICRMPLGQLQQTLTKWKLSARDRRIAGELLREIKNRVRFLNDVGLHYLSLSRPAATLSNGEAQRIRLASQLGSGLCGVLYVLDEPTIGLHPRDNRRLLAALHKLRDLGNTLLIVEHDREVMQGSDYICDFGPEAGKRGGEIVAQGTPAQLARRRASLTGLYLSGKKAIPVPTNRRLVERDGEYAWAHQEPPIVHSDANDPDTNDPGANDPGANDAGANDPGANGSGANDSSSSRAAAAPSAASTSARRGPDWLTIRGARHNNLRNIDVRIPLGTLTAVTGPSGSGKSSLIDEILYAGLARKLHRASVIPGPHDDIEGIDSINKVIRVDQQPLGNSPTSNPATYTGVFELIRMLFAQLPQAKLRGYSARRFSFNVPGGRCDHCEGNGQIRIEMHFLPDVWVPCDTCHGRRYNPETLEVTFHGRSISDVLDMTCGEAAELMKNIPKIRRILQTLCDVGLDYVTLGQSAPTLSGGEAQRVKLAAELARPDTGRTLYLLDEPTTGLHFDDLARLLDVMQRLVDLGNSVVVIEHNLDVVKSADWVIDMGPEAGLEGGLVVAEGTPEQVVELARRRLQESAESALEKSSPKKTPSKKTPSKKTSVKKSRRAAPTGPTALAEGPRSHTGEALLPLLEAGPHLPRQIFDPRQADTEAKDDLDIADVGRGAKMPWETDGRRWHTRDRVDRKGGPCRWSGEVLERVVDRIHDLGPFAETDWNTRSVVEITGERKSDGWFFHAITGETWLLKMKFRVARGTFRREDLLERLPLRTLNEMDELPIYGNEPRVACRAQQGPWQEVQISVHSLEEIDTPEFWRFVEEAVGGFQKVTERAAEDPHQWTPWKKLGRKWHFLQRGFPSGQKILWKNEVLERLCEMLEKTAPEGEFQWTNKQLVHYVVPAQREPWATIQTKKPQSLRLFLTGPKDLVTLGRIAELGHYRDFDATRTNVDLVQLRFRALKDLEKGDLRDFLREHYDGVKRSAEQFAR